MTPAAKAAMATHSIGPAWVVLGVLLVVSAVTHAADPAPATTPADTAPAAEQGGTSPADTAAASGAEPASPAESNAPIDQAMPAVPEPLLLARFEAKTLSADFIKLGDDTQPFLARYRAATKPPAKGAILFIPAPAQFISDDAVIAAALTELPAGGWSVLAIQMPLLPAVATMQQYADSHDQALARAKTALEYLTQQQTPAKLVVGRAANIELAREVATSAGQNTALVALGPWSGQIGASKLPLFDVSPDRDHLALARARERHEEASHIKLPVYKQVVLNGANRHFVGFESEIVRRVRGFAERLPKAGKN